MVLLTSVSDYWAYDRWDPAAPMNAPGPEAMTTFVSNAALNVTLYSTTLPDDHCLCCSPWVAPPPPVLPRCRASSSVAQAISAFIPTRNPARIERPPKGVTPSDLQPFLLPAEEVSSFVGSVAARVVDSTNGDIPPPQV